MTRPHRTGSPEKKRAVLSNLASYKGDVFRNSPPTGVNQRTIQRWRAKPAATCATATWAEGSVSRDLATSATSNRDIDVAATRWIDREVSLTPPAARRADRSPQELIMTLKFG